MDAKKQNRFKNINFGHLPEQWKVWPNNSVVRATVIWSEGRWFNSHPGRSFLLPCVGRAISITKADTQIDNGITLHYFCVHKGSREVEPGNTKINFRWLSEQEMNPDLRIYLLAHAVFWYSLRNWNTTIRELKQRRSWIMDSDWTQCVFLFPLPLRD